MYDAARQLEGCRLGAAGLALLACAIGCQPAAFDELGASPPAGGAGHDGAVVDDSELDAGAADAGAMDGALMLDAGALDSDLPDASLQGIDAGAPTDSPAAEPVTVVLTIQKDEDDGFWYRPEQALVEKLHFEPTPGDFDDFSFEVGTDSEQCRAALRFAVPIGPGATVLSASLRLRRTGPAFHAPAFATMQVRVFESSNVAPLAASHTHTTLADHTPGGLWSEAVRGFAVGEVNTDTVSPDLSVLVQHVLGRPDWQAGGYMGFVLLPDAMEPEKFAQFEDKAGELAPAVLTIRYRR